MRPTTRPLRRRPDESDLAFRRLCAPVDGAGLERRRFLQGALAAGGVVATMPTWFDGIAGAGAPLAANDRVLVTVYLNGGNDHLNTLVPHDNGLYRSKRRSIAVGVRAADSVGEGMYLNPVMPRLKSRFDAGQVAFVRGVGEASDDRSHFSSTATWMAGARGQANPTGWLGRYMDGAGLDGLGAVAVGDGGVPLLLRGANTTATVVRESGNLFGADRSDRWERYAIEAISRMGADGAGVGLYGPTVSSSWAAAVDTASSLSPAVGGSLPAEGLARRLAIAAEVVNLNLGTQILSVELHGFDTHDEQTGTHEALLAELDAGIDTFFARLAPAFQGRAAMLVFSEFGRRVEMNGTGTDHGTAGMVTLVGPRVNGGLHGQQPSLKNLDSRGDMHHHVDFREVYAAVLSKWLRADDRQILGANYSGLDLFRADSWSPAPPPQAPPTVTTGGVAGFSDVAAGEYYAAAVTWLAATGITTGTAPGVFSPGDPVTRGQMATFLWRYRSKPTGSPAANFADVPRGRFYSEAVDWLASTGITKGTAPGIFSPEDVVTRGQMATFLWRLEGSPAGSPAANFADVPRGRFYSDAVDWLANRGITAGTGNNRFSPEDAVNRAQMATFLWRLAGSPPV